MSKENLMETHAREKAEMPPEWGCYFFEHLGSPSQSLGIKIIGAIAPPFKSGPRKGQSNWQQKDPATKRTVYFGPTEHADWLARWELRTGTCSRCVGDGKTLFSAHRDGTRTYKWCAKCGGTGKAKAAAELVRPEGKGEGA